VADALRVYEGVVLVKRIISNRSYSS
jgi:hypothetical protein